jgi:hypothetical protein
VIVEDNVVCFPAIHHSGRPWARIVSCNPLEMKDAAIPPVFSGYPAGDHTGWDEFRRVQPGDRRPLASSRPSARRGAHHFLLRSSFTSPSRLRVSGRGLRGRPLAPTWHRMDRVSGGGQASNYRTSRGRGAGVPLPRQPRFADVNL